MDPLGFLPVILRSSRPPLVVETLINSQALAQYSQRRVGTPVDMTVMLPARSTEANSSITAFRIAWDGDWEDGDTEMARHLVIEQLPQR